MIDSNRRQGQVRLKIRSIDTDLEISPIGQYRPPADAPSQVRPCSISDPRLFKRALRKIERKDPTRPKELNAIVEVESQHTLIADRIISCHFFAFSIHMIVGQAQLTVLNIIKLVSHLDAKPILWRNERSLFRHHRKTGIAVIESKPSKEQNNAK